MNRIDMQTICIFIVLVFLSSFFASIAYAEPQRCQRFWDLKDPVKPIPWRAKRRRVPSYVKRWRSLVAHSPRNIKAHIFYKTRKIRPTTTWGNFGWDKSLSTYRNKSDRYYAKIFSLGGYPGELDNLEFDIDMHYRFAREHRCLNRWKDIHRSFMESIRIRKFSAQAK